MIAIQPGDVGLLYKRGLTSLFQRVFLPRTEAPDHVWVHETATVIREALPPVVRVCSWKRTYGPAIRQGKIRVKIGRYRVGAAEARKGLCYMAERHPIGQQYDYGRLWMGMFPSKRRAICSMLVESFKLGALGIPVPWITKRPRMRPSPPTVTPLHIVRDPDFEIIGEIRWTGEQFELWGAT